MSEVIFFSGSEEQRDKKIRKLISDGTLKRVEIPFNTTLMAEFFGDRIDLLKAKCFIMDNMVCFNTLFKEETA